MKVSVIGPTDLEKLSNRLGKPVEYLLERAALVGKILAEGGYELLVNGDKGMLDAVAESYRAHGGTRLTVLYPLKPYPWPLDHTEPYVRYADKIVRPPDWFSTNYEVVSEPCVCVCVGMSSGTLSEVAYINWDHEFHTGNLKVLIAVRELVRGGVFPLEIEPDKDVLNYVETVEDLAQVLQELCLKELIPA